MKTARIIAVSFIAGALILVVGAFLLREYRPATTTQTASAAAQSGQQAAANSDNPLVAETAKAAPTGASVEGGHWAENAVTTFSRLLLAVLLSGVLAFR